VAGVSPQNFMAHLDWAVADLESGSTVAKIWASCKIFGKLTWWSVITDDDDDDDEFYSLLGARGDS